MYAVIQSGGKQYKVEEGQQVKLEKLDAEVGGEIQFDKVMMIANGEDLTIGTPEVEGAVVKAEVVAHGRQPKIKILKFRRRKHHMKRQGHRQYCTTVKITKIGK